jgi:biopolymer transport protein ExbD
MKGLSLSNPTRTPSRAAETADIDVTPIMNMFIILIPFLVSMAVFTQMSIIELALPPNVGAGLDQSKGKPKLKLTVVAARSFLGITLGEEMLDSIPAAGGSHDYETFRTRLTERRRQVDIQDEAIVAVRDPVRFQQVVRVMDNCREAGFVELGLSSAPEGD